MPSLRDLQHQADTGYGRVHDALEEAGENPVPLPKPPPHYDEQLEVYRQAGLVQHANDQLYRIRCWQAEAMGFPLVTLDAVATRIAGDDASVVSSTGEGQRQLEYYHDLSSDKDFRPGRHGGAKKMTLTRIRGIRHTDEYLLYWFPYRKEHVVWEVLHRPVDDLAAPIPFGVMLRMEEIKRARLFSCFSVLAPAALFRRILPDRLDPVLIGTVARPPIEGCVPAGDGVRHFVVARWDHANEERRPTTSNATV